MKERLVGDSLFKPDNTQKSKSSESMDVASELFSDKDKQGLNATNLDDNFTSFKGAEEQKVEVSDFQKDSNKNGAEKDDSEDSDEPEVASELDSPIGGFESRGMIKQNSQSHR